MKHIFLFIFIVWGTTIIAQKISEKQKQFLFSKGAQLANSYHQVLQKITDKKVASFEKSLLIKNLFGSWDFPIYNLVAIDNKNKYISISEFLEAIEKDYPAGIIFNVELGDINNIIIGHYKEDEYRIHASIPIVLKVLGIYKGKRIVRKEQQLFMVYSFLKKGNRTLTSFKLVEIAPMKDLLALEDYSYNGLEIYYGQSKNKLKSVLENPYEIKHSNTNYTQFGIGYYKSLGKLLAVKLGIFYKTSSIALNWKNLDNKVFFTQNGTEVSKLHPKDYDVSNDNLFKDIDGDVMLPYVTSNGVKDSREQRLFHIPISLELKYDKIGRFIPYLYGGISIWYKYSTKVNVYGDFETQGYYPQYDFILHDLPDYGYMTNEIDSSFTISNNKFSIAPHFGLGTRFNLTKNIAINLQLFWTIILDNKLFFEYKSKNTLYKLSPEYTIEQFITNDVISTSAPNISSSWLDIPVSSHSDFGINFGIFYKF